MANLVAITALAEATNEGQTWWTYKNTDDDDYDDDDDDDEEDELEEFEDDDDDEERRLRDSPIVQHRKRKNQENNTADTAWNLMLWWHVGVFYPTFTLWFMQLIIKDLPLYEWFFMYFVNFSMAGVYGIYEIIFFMLLFSVALDTNTVEKDYWLCLGYFLINLVTGVLQYVWHPDAVNDYYNRYRTWDELAEDGVYEETEEEDT